MVSALDALILCGGLGTRLREVVTDRPKGLAEIRGRPFLDLLIDELARQGLKRFILCTGYRGEQIEKWLAADLRQALGPVGDQWTQPRAEAAAEDQRVERRYHSMVLRTPSRKSVFARKPISAAALEVSTSLKGIIVGLEGSNRMFAPR